MKSNADQFTCFIIGEGSLPIQCAKMLLEGGHRILGVISADSEVCRWAQQQKLFVYDPSDDNKALFASKLISLLQAQPFDYLFSIVNSFILPNEILMLPDNVAINYHDAPLPKYAGMYATSWAIMNREVKHGISWHVMTEEIDAGDILKQPMLDIEPHDTALTLNAKCYEAAIGAFGELIDELARDQTTPVRQNLAERTYFSRYKRPPAGAVISWQQTAEEIYALSRALTFGSYANYLSLPKLALGEDLFIVADLALPSIGSPSTLRHAVIEPVEMQDGAGSGTVEPPGTIISIEIDENQEKKAARTTLTVATRSGRVIIKELLTIDGAACSLSELVTRYELRVETTLHDLSPAIADAITSKNRKIARHEAFWRQRLLTLQLLEPPYRKAGGGVSDAKRVALQQAQEPGLTCSSDNVATLGLSIPDNVMSFLQERNWTADHFLLTLLAVYLTRLNDNHNDVDYFDVALTLVPQIRGVEGFFALQIPLRVAIDAELGFEQAYKRLKRERALCTRRQTYARDMVARYPELRSKPELQDLPPISVTITETLVSEPLATHDGLSVYLANDTAIDGSDALDYTGPGTTKAWPERRRRVVTTSQKHDLQGLIAYKRDLFEQEVIGSMVGHLQTLMEAVVATPEQAIKTLPLLTEAERHQLLVEWNTSNTPSQVDEMKGDKCIHHLFEQQVERTPDALAVIPSTSSGHRFGDEQLTYRELNEDVNKLTHYLIRLGVKANVMVGLYVERSPQMLVGLLAILKVGGVYLPLDPSYPSARLAFMIRDAAVDFVVTDGKNDLPDEIMPNHVQIIDLNNPEVSRQPTSNPISRVTPDDLAYVIYTSGSTGQPKGVMVAHAPFAQHCQLVQQHYELTCQDRVLQFASLNFDVSLEQIFPTLLAGASIVIGQLWSPSEFHHYLNAFGLTVMDLPLGYFQQLLSFWTTEPTLVANHTLRLLIIGNEAIPGEFVTLWQDSPLHQVRLINAYGPTEAVISTTFYDVSPNLDPVRFASSLPIANQIKKSSPKGRQLYILDAQMEPVPIGVAGELYIGGILAQGYLNRPSLTADVFVANPFVSDARLYKTGDLARYLADTQGAGSGTVEFLGRIDQQVKIRGFRVELGEIEAQLRQHEQIDEAVVVYREEQLIAYLVTQQQAITIDALRAFLRNRLPEQLVPTVFIPLDDIPRTANDKIDRQALSALSIERIETRLAQNDMVEPRTATEQQIAAIWSEILAHDAIGIFDNFFDLGGHSLLALQVANQIQRTFEVTLPIQTLFERVSVAKLAEHVEALVAVRQMQATAIIYQENEMTVEDIYSQDITESSMQEIEEW